MQAGARWQHGLLLVNKEPVAARDDAGALHVSPPVSLGQPALFPFIPSTGSTAAGQSAHHCMPIHTPRPANLNKRLRQP